MARGTETQLFTSIYAFPAADKAVTMTFNAALGNAGLKGFTVDIYTYTGLVTDKSTSLSDWKYVKADWNENIPACKLTRIGIDLYEMENSPCIRDFYEDPANEPIDSLAFVFRSVDGLIHIGDPYADKVSDPWKDRYISNTTYPNLIAYPKGKTSGIATVLETGQKPYNWKVTDFKAPNLKNAVVYELLVRNITKGHTFNHLIDTLDYMKRLGVTANKRLVAGETYSLLPKLLSDKKRECKNWVKQMLRFIYLFDFKHKMYYICEVTVN